MKKAPHHMCNYPEFIQHVAMHVAFTHISVYQIDSLRNESPHFFDLAKKKSDQPLCSGIKFDWSYFCKLLESSYVLRQKLQQALNFQKDFLSKSVKLKFGCLGSGENSGDFHMLRLYFQCKFWNFQAKTRSSFYWIGNPRGVKSWQRPIIIVVPPDMLEK